MCILPLSSGVLPGTTWKKRSAALVVDSGGCWLGDWGGDRWVLTGTTGRDGLPVGCNVRAQPWTAYRWVLTL